MRSAGVILPNQLSPNSPLLSVASDFILFEHPHFFLRHRYHKKKLLLHRASMKAYEQQLRGRRLRVSYVDADRHPSLVSLADALRGHDIEKLYVIDPVDHGLCHELDELRAAKRLNLEVFDNPQFLTDAETLRSMLGSRERYQMASFYIQQRKRLGILVEEGRPIGGKWSFDPQNRRRLPKDIRIPGVSRAPTGPHIAEARKYVEDRFGANPGATEGWFFPTTHGDAQAWLNDFMANRLGLFGPYEDAISKDRAVLFHSVLSPLLNIGLLDPHDTVKQVIEHGRQHSVEIASLEGFVRQVIGWREFIRGVYLCVGREQEQANFWQFTKPLPQSFYDGSTGIEPVDTIVRRVVQNAFAHHIERLMILGNFMLLCEVHPDNVYRWFTELFIDAYDWVMVPNVYGMSQYADGGRITTKPYISSSNYVRKMSDFPKGPWCDIWDGLFWRFISRHRDVCTANPRMRVMTTQLDRMDRQVLKTHLDRAERFLGRLFA